MLYFRPICLTWILSKVSSLQISSLGLAFDWVLTKASLLWWMDASTFCETIFSSYFIVAATYVWSVFLVSFLPGWHFMLMRSTCVVYNFLFVAWDIFFSGIEFFSCVVYFFLFYVILLPKKRFDASLCWRSKERRKGEGKRRMRGIRRRRKRNSSSSSSCCLGGQWLNRQRERCLPPILTTWFNSGNQHGRRRELPAGSSPMISTWSLWHLYEHNKKKVLQ